MLGDHSFLYNYLNGLLTITPKNNLSMNIGVESSRVNSNNQFDVQFRPSDENFKVCKHPESISINEKYDRIHFKNHINYKPSIVKRVFSKLKRIFS